MKKSILYKPYSVNRKLPLNYNEINGKEKFITINYQYGTTYLCSLEKAYVTPYGVVMSKWRIVKESIYSMFSSRGFYPTFLKKKLLGKIKFVSGTCIVATNSFYNNYYHFTAEALPRLFSVKEYSRSASLLIHEKQPKFIKEYLELLGFNNIAPVKDDELAFAEELLLPMHTADGLSHNSGLLKEMNKWFQEKVKSYNSKFSNYKNVYISRSKAAYRNITNEEELLKIVAQHGFKIINFEDFTVAEQIAMMSQVKNCVGIHGAGLTNIMFMKEGGVVFNLIHELHYDPAFYNLSDAMNLEYVLIQGSAANKDPRGVAWDSFSIDISKFQSYLEKYLK